MSFATPHKVGTQRENDRHGSRNDDDEFIHSWLQSPRSLTGWPGARPMPGVQTTVDPSLPIQ